MLSSPEEDRLQRARGFLLDLDGTVYLGSRLLPGAKELIEALDRSGRKRLFLTNNSSRSASTYAARLQGMGIAADAGGVLTSGDAAILHLRRQGRRRIYLLGTPELEEDFRRAGFELASAAPECVVLGFDTTLHYGKLERAVRFLLDGVPFLATHPDRLCPTEDGWLPDCGSLAALLEAATGVHPEIAGKPCAPMVEAALSRLALPATEVAMVGDRLYTDMEMARENGLLGILVLTGETTRAMLEEAGEALRPLAIESLAELARCLR